MKSILHTDLSAFILAGGKSSRMGRDKALLSVQNQKLIVYSIELAKLFTRNVFISGKKLEYQEFKTPMIQDQISDIGPLGGIYSCLSISGNPYNLFLPCDTPFIEPFIIQRLINEIKSSENHGVIASTSTNKEPLIAIFKKEILPQIESMINQKDYKIQHLLKLINCREIDFTENSISNPNLFRNLNSPHDL
jgi:molybdenum cofactor guanylyltransferase